MQGRELCRHDFMKHTFDTVMYQDTCELINFQTWYGAKHYLTLQCDSSLNDLDVHSGSQGYDKGRTCAVIVL